MESAQTGLPSPVLMSPDLYQVDRKAPQNQYITEVTTQAQETFRLFGLLIGRVFTLRLNTKRAERLFPSEVQRRGLAFTKKQLDSINQEFLKVGFEPTQKLFDSALQIYKKEEWGPKRIFLVTLLINRALENKEFKTRISVDNMREMEAFYSRSLWSFTLNKEMLNQENSKFEKLQRKLLALVELDEKQRPYSIAISADWPSIEDEKYLKIEKMLRELVLASKEAKLIHNSIATQEINWEVAQNILLKLQEINAKYNEALREYEMYQKQNLQSKLLELESGIRELGKNVKENPTENEIRDNEKLKEEIELKKKFFNDYIDLFAQTLDKLYKKQNTLAERLKELGVAVVFNYTDTVKGHFGFSTSFVKVYARPINIAPLPQFSEDPYVEIATLYRDLSELLQSALIAEKQVKQKKPSPFSLKEINEKYMNAHVIMIGNFGTEYPPLFQGVFKNINDQESDASERKSFITLYYGKTMEVLTQLFEVQNRIAVELNNQGVQIPLSYKVTTPVWMGWSTKEVAVYSHPLTTGLYIPNNSNTIPATETEPYEIKQFTVDYSDIKLEMVKLFKLREKLQLYLYSFFYSARSNEILQQFREELNEYKKEHKDFYQKITKAIEFAEIEHAKLDLSPLERIEIDYLLKQLALLFQEKFPQEKIKLQMEDIKEAEQIIYMKRDQLARRIAVLKELKGLLEQYYNYIHTNSKEGTKLVEMDIGTNLWQKTLIPFLEGRAELRLRAHLLKVALQQTHKSCTEFSDYSKEFHDIVRLIEEGYQLKIFEKVEEQIKESSQIEQCYLNGLITRIKRAESWIVSDLKECEKMFPAKADLQKVLSYKEYYRTDMTEVKE